MKLVRRRQGDGTYLMAARGEDLVQPLAVSLFHEKDDLIDIFSLRKLIEPEVARLASENADPLGVRHLQKILKTQEKQVRLGRNPMQTDFEFHQTLARMARNRIFERLLMAIMDLLQRTRNEYLQTEERKQSSLLGHRQILKAIQVGDGKKARQAMRQHLEKVEGILLRKEAQRMR